ncbi:MAG: ScpA family protein [Pseudomonadota bacterium]
MSNDPEIATPDDTVTDAPDADEAGLEERDGESSAAAPADNVQSGEADAEASAKDDADDNASDDPSAPVTSTTAEAEDEEAFDAPVRTAPEDAVDVDALIVNIEGYEGPLDVLLDLARSQKVDLRKIAILPLVEQYLAFVEAAKARRLELAADYLVMASWLTFLKTKLLLPAPAEDAAEPTADEMAARLAFQLQRLEAMRGACDTLFKLPQKGDAFFHRGAPTGVAVTRKTAWQADLYDLLKAYARQRVASAERTYHVKPPAVYSIEDARRRLERVLGQIPDWVDLRSLAVADDGVADAPHQSVVASAFNAALEFAKDGKMELRQLGPYEPLYVRRRAEPRVDSDQPPAHG